MVNRVCLGLKGTSYGLWISKSGVDVLTASEANMLFSSTRKTIQVIQSTSVVYAAEAVANSRSKTITHTDYGFRPFVILEFRGFTQAEYESGPDSTNWVYTLSARTQTSFTFDRPGITINSATQWKGFTLYYRLLSVGYGSI